jgi:hypothetical protein
VTPDCREACAGSGDGAAALFAALENVVYGTCSTACAYGQDWSCLGRVTWPAPAATTTTIVWEGVHDALTSVRIANAQAAICGTVGNGNLPCDSPLAQGQTDDAGYIAFQVPTALGNSTNPMGIELYGAVSAPGYMPTYGYYFFPLSQSVITWAPGLSPPLWSLSMNPFTGGPSVPGAYTDTGFVLVVVLDCQGHTASGVQVTPGDPSAGTAVLTTANGIAVFNGSAGTGVAVGNLVVSAAPVGLKQEIGHVGFYVRAGAATAALLQPQP